MIVSDFPFPPKLLSTIPHAQTLASIQGTRLFEELETLEESLRSSLPESPEEKSLLQDFHQLELLKRFAKLELTHKDWEEVKVIARRFTLSLKEGEGRVREATAMDVRTLTLPSPFSRERGKY